MRLRTLFALVGLVALLVSVGIASRADAQPTYRATGAVFTGAAATTALLPASTATGDLLVVVCEMGSADTIGAPGAQWTAVTCSPVTSGGTRLAVAWHIVLSTDVDGDCTDAPVTCAFAKAGDHSMCRIIGITTGTFNTSAPVEACTSNTQTATADV